MKRGDGLRALITQREMTDRHGVPIDVLESTYVYYFEALGIELRPLSNFHTHLDSILNESEFDLLILTGGGDVGASYYDKSPQVASQIKRDSTERVAVYKAFEKKIPVLGICRGMQYMNGLIGGKVSRLADLIAPRPIGPNHPVMLSNGSMIDVNNYHDDGLYLPLLAKGLKVVAWDKENNTVEAFYSVEKKVLGLQWHPERSFTDLHSQETSSQLIRKFIQNGGVLDESNYFSSRPGHPA